MAIWGRQVKCSRNVFTASQSHAVQLIKEQIILLDHLLKLVSNLLILVRLHNILYLSPYVLRKLWVNI